jgi:competence protein ComEC
MDQLLLVARAPKRSICRGVDSHGRLDRLGESNVRALLSAVTRIVLLLMGICLLTASQSPPLRMYFVDVEGGQATLIVAPSGQSLLIDAGGPDFNGRDAQRILDAAKAAEVSRIDFMLVTHYHDDHVGGVPQLADRIKIGTFVDHGVNRENSDDTRANYSAYEKAFGSTKRIVVKPGDRIPIDGLDVEVVSADGALISKPMSSGGQANPLCAAEPAAPDDPSENSRSLGVLITYGHLRVLDLGDLTKQKELGLVCPANLLGTIDLFVVSHHGFTQSDSRALVHALQPRVAIMDNGARKGGSPDVWETVHNSPGLVDLWQLHYSIEGGKNHNVTENFIANPEEKCEGKRIDVVADADGTIVVTNMRNGFAKTYRK